MPAGAADRADIEFLLDAAFGTDRHGRTAYRLREGAEPLTDLSLVARNGGRLVGSIQYWPIELVCADSGARHGLTLLGPVAVLPELQSQGLGKALMRHSLAIADAHGHAAMLLIGDPEYYGRFDFTSDATAQWVVPGPVERHRLLARITDKALKLPTVGTLGPVSRAVLAA